MPRRLQVEPFKLPAGASFWHGFAPATLKRIDLAGALLLLGSCLMISTAIQQATASTSFASPEILPLNMGLGSINGNAPAFPLD